ncbi:MAG: alanine racemase [Methyloprofundus sp.]|nr:alanine racemase [Methyloprofundus sp.]
MPVAAHIELDLSALQHNVHRVREYAPKSQLMAVIKANAYGHGLLRVANHLKGEVDAVAVARLDEAMCLRGAHIQGRILVLQGFSQANEIPVLQKYQLEVVIHSVEQVAILESLNKQGSLRVWLKIDTGMNRLGINPAKFVEILSRLQQCKLVHPSIGFMTHFANADDEQDEKTMRQLQLFNDTIGAYSGEKSSANSAGLMSWPASRQDWVRPGLMLYGVSPLLAKTAAQLNLLPVMSLYSRIIAIKQVKKGQAVGYGGSWLAEKDALIAVVSIGYGDGYPRHAKQGTPAIINNQRVPLIGRVSMDMLTLDLSGTRHIKLGDKVKLWGEGLPVEEIAAYAETIPYTLLCGITQRVQVYEKG